MVADLTPAELTLLGLLVEKPRHGYELDDVISTRGMREWTEIGFSSIYYLLARLRDRGLITEIDTRRPARGKARRVYGPTAEGRRACARSAEAAVAELRPVFPPLLVGLANQPVIAPERLRAALDRRAAALTEKIAAIGAARDAQPEMPDFVRAIFDYALGQLAAEQQWLATYRATELGTQSRNNQPAKKEDGP
ncbi:MAG: PadR family transcriptional regulator [Micromonosporaceae bacterium]